MGKPKKIIGIDPGASNGGIAIWENGKPVRVARVPKNEEMNRLKTFLIEERKNKSDTVVFIEKVQMFGSDSSEENAGKQYRIKVMLANYERLIALMMFIGIPYVEVYPQSWQSTLKLRFKGISKTQKKNKFKEYAQNCFPEIKVTLWSSDALCLIQFALRKYSDAPKWIDERIKGKEKNLF